MTPSKNWGDDLEEEEKKEVAVVYKVEEDPDADDLFADPNDMDLNADIEEEEREDWETENVSHPQVRKVFQGELAHATLTLDQPECRWHGKALRLVDQVLQRRDPSRPNKPGHGTIPFNKSLRHVCHWCKKVQTGFQVRYVRGGVRKSLRVFDRPAGGLGLDILLTEDPISRTFAVQHFAWKCTTCRTVRLYLKGIVACV